MISVIVPLYNVEKYILNCLRSISDQTYRDFELILVDDGSKDDSASVAEKYLKTCDLNYKVLKKENGGQSSARNYGLKEAKGEYVIFLDSDDVVSPHFLERLLEHFDEKTNLSFCSYQYVKSQTPPDEEKREKVIFEKKELIEGFLKRTIAFVVPSMLFRKSFLLENDLWFRENIRYSEDQPFIWEAFFKADRAIYHPERLYGYYLRESSIMTGSPYDRITKGLNVFSRFCDELREKYPEYSREISMILPRWELGTLYTSANLLDYPDYKKIYQMMDGRSVLKRVMGIKEIKAYLLAGVCSLSPRFLYELCKRMNLNG